MRVRAKGVGVGVVAGGGGGGGGGVSGELRYLGVFGVSGVFGCIFFFGGGEFGFGFGCLRGKGKGGGKEKVQTEQKVWGGREGGK